MKAISIRQPWAWLIIYGGKNVENRTKQFHHRGTLGIASSLNMTRDELNQAIAFVEKFDPILAHAIPSYHQLARGRLIGVVDVVGCKHIESPLAPKKSPWCVGPWCIQLSNARKCRPIPVKGRLGLFDIPDGLIRYP